MLTREFPVTLLKVLIIDLGPTEERPVKSIEADDIEPRRLSRTRAQGSDLIMGPIGTIPTASGPWPN